MSSTSFNARENAPYRNPKPQSEGTTKQCTGMANFPEGRYEARWSKNQTGQGQFHPYRLPPLPSLPFFLLVQLPTSTPFGSNCSYGFRHISHIKTFVTPVDIAGLSSFFPTSHHCQGELLLLEAFLPRWPWGSLRNDTCVCDTSSI